MNMNEKNERKPEWVFIETDPGKAAIARDASLVDKRLLEDHPLRDRLEMGLWFLLHPKWLLGKRPLTSFRVDFVDFKASPKPDIKPSACLACQSQLVWKPGPYSFGERRIFYSVPDIGIWRCPNGHPGKIYNPDYQRFAALHIEINDLPLRIRLKL